jgi:MYXO-CTERM domain-containing protein
MVYGAVPEMTRSLAKIGVVACALLAAPPARAFLVVGTEAGQTAGPELRVVMVHEDGRNIVAVSPTVRGPAKPLAVVLPLQQAAAESLAAAPVTLFERTAKLAAPRADELWELDPCELHPNQQSAPPTPSASAAASASASAAPRAMPSVVGGYEITVLSAADSANAAKWLGDHGYKVPDGAAEALSTAVKGGAVLAVARIDGAQLTFDKDVARLPPLSFVTEGPPALPLRLAGLGAPGARDVVLDVLSPGARLEATSLLNVAVPTNLDVREEAKSDVDGLYRSIVDYTLEKTPGAAMTEYAWLASTCDGCAEGTGLGAEELLALGVDRLPSGGDGSQREVIVDVAESLSRAPEGPAALKPAVAACYAKALGEMRGLAGDAKVTIETGAGGAVKSAKIQDATAEALGRCVEEAARSVKFDKADASGAITARFALLSRAYLASMVLTRLRVRAPSGPGGDVELRRAAPIEGGREEGPIGEAEKKVYFATHTNNFRARYVVRHPWPGAIACEEPKRGVWGAKPKNLPPPSPRTPSSASASAKPAASTSASGSAKPAAPSAAERRLIELLEGGELPDLSAYAIAYRAAEPPKPATAPTTTPTASAAATPSGSAQAPSAGGCGCRAATGPTPLPAWLAITAIGAALLRIRKRYR